MKKFGHTKLNDFIRLKFTWCILTFLIIPIFCFAQIKTTVFDIVSNPDKYHGKIVQVEGKAVSVKFKTSKRGNPYTVFELTDGKNYVSVFSFCTLPVKEGDEVKVKGTYHKKYMFYPETKTTGRGWLHETYLGEEENILINGIDATNGRIEKNKGGGKLCKNY